MTTPTIDRVGAGHPHRIAHDLRSTFGRLHGRAPSDVFAAPGRVNLMGEHTDYNGGLCLPVALPHAAYTAIGRRDDDTVTFTSLQQPDVFIARISDLSAETVSGWAAYAAGVVWALREAGVDLPGMDLVIDSRVPLGAGLSSSAAIECSVALAACGIARRAVDDETRRHLVGVCMRAEREVAGAPTGGMDQTVSLLGQEGSALLIDCRNWHTEQVTWPFHDGSVHLLVVDTRASHALSDGQYAARRTDCELAAAQLGVGSLRDVADVAGALDRLADGRLRRRARHVFSENQRVADAASALRTGDAPALGASFDESHASLRDDFEVSCAELDTVVEAARDAGALGARMTGGGFGGSAIVLVDQAAVDSVEAAIAAAFDARGWTPPGFLRATPAAGARQVHAEALT